MSTPNDERTYTVIETPFGQFDENWAEAVRLGYLNPEQEANDRAWLELTLARNPYVGTQMYGDLWAVGYDDPGSQVIYWYHITEDDRLVELTAVTWRQR